MSVGTNGIQHFSERVSESLCTVQDLDVQFSSFLESETELHEREREKVSHIGRLEGEEKGGKGRRYLIGSAIVRITSSYVTQNRLAHAVL